MTINFPLLSFLTMLLFFLSCGKDDVSSTTTLETPIATNLPELSIENAVTTEGDDGQTAMTFNIKVEGTYTQDIEVTYKTLDASAIAGADYIPVEEKLTIVSPDTTASITINLVADFLREGNEHFKVQLDEPINATIKESIAKGIINNDDSADDETPEGYTSPENYDFWKLKWSDEFDGTTINEDNWTFEMGNGCGQGLCGWGNNEREFYTADSTNARLEDGKLIIEAAESDLYNYTSARMISKDKKTFRFGRIDVRAKLPKGQGIWPAIWMLGKNIDQVGWPACGEIDIMELVGHQPNTVHGTAHFGPPSPNNRFLGSPISSRNGDFSEKYHVFSLVWLPGTIYWYMDDVLFNEMNTEKVGSDRYPFNQEFFFIMNVAVGGNWPGNPDETTVFPQRMEVDYIRVFERE